MKKKLPWRTMLGALHGFNANTFGIKKLVILPLTILITLFLWLVPTEFFGIEGLTVVQQRTIAIFAFAALMWLFEVIPAWTTSVLLIVLMLFTISNKGIGLLMTEIVAEDGTTTFAEGTFVNYKDLMASFADPIVMLFLGGFVLAIAATKVGLDTRLAKAMLTPFGSNPKYVLLGFLLIIGCFSMFMSNTATAAMMLAILTPVLKELPADGKGRIGLALSIPIAANIGGIGTPIGTPPNAIALGALNSIGIEIPFATWMARMVPLAIVLLLIAWVMLLVMFPFKTKEIKLEIKADTAKTYKNYIVYVTFALTILLWITEQWTKINSNVVALLPFAVFTCTGVFDKKDLKEINWAVLWMVAGGIALGTALNKTGLANTLINAIPFDTWTPLVVILVTGLIGYVLSNFIANSSAANLLAPILATIAVAMGENMAALGGPKTMLVGMALATSMAMLLPISTPPNAIAASTGMIETKDMVKAGAVIGVIGLVMAYGMLFFIGF